MQLTQKEQDTLKDLQTQEENCIQKYAKYAGDAKDPVLKDLFNTLKAREQEHYRTIGQIMSGTVPSCDCNDDEGKNYALTATYTAADQSDDKQSDAFLATDSISVEKMVSSEYNSDVFAFSDSGIRKALADIQIEEQNHAEMLNKYKQTNGMS